MIAATDGVDGYVGSRQQGQLGAGGVGSRPSERTGGLSHVSGMWSELDPSESGERHAGELGPSESSERHAE